MPSKHAADSTSTHAWQTDTCLGFELPGEALKCVAHCIQRLADDGLHRRPHRLGLHTQRENSRLLCRGTSQPRPAVALVRAEATGMAIARR
jgi:hypothetical protein